MDLIWTESAKYIIGFVLGLVTSWSIQRIRFDVAEFEGHLKALDDCASQFEIAARGNLAGHPDPPTLVIAATSRTALGIGLARTFGRRAEYQQIKDTLKLFSQTLQHADPAMQRPAISADDAAQEIRDRQQGLRAAIEAACAVSIWWRARRWIPRS